MSGKESGLHSADTEAVYWSETVPTCPVASPLRGARDVDVAIVGGGFTGLSTAYHLCRERAGIAVAVLEAGTVGSGASGRNAGFAMTAFGLSLSVTLGLYGVERTRQAFLHMVGAVDYLDELVRANALDCDYERTGFLRVATTPAYVRRIQEELRIAARIGLDGVYWLDGRQTRDRVDSPLFLGAWWEPRCALLNPLKLVHGLRRLAERAGAVVHEHTPVEQIDLSNGPLLVTPGGTVKAHKIVFATNAFSHLLPPLRRKQVPAFTHVVATEPLPSDRLGEIGWQGRHGIEDARNLLHYFRLTSDNRLMIGGGPVGISYGKAMDHNRGAAAFEHLRRWMGRIFPPLRNARISHTWGGPVSVTLDLAPALGHGRDPRVLYSVGCTGHGVTLTVLNGRILSDLVLGLKTELTDRWFVNRRVVPWPPEPIRVAASVAIRGALQLQDAWNEKRGGARRITSRLATRTGI